MVLRVINQILAWSYFRKNKIYHGANNETPTVSVIVPVKGLDEYAIENFRSICQQEYQNTYEVIFAVEEDDDPVVDVIKSIIQEYDDEYRVHLVLSGHRDIKASGKIRNLIAGYAESRNEVIVFIDSDVWVPSTFLLQTVIAVSSSEVGLAFAVPVCQGTDNLVAALHNLAVNDSALHYAAAASRDRLNAAVGSVMVTRRNVIEEIGGLESLGQHIVGIDIIISQSIRRAGYKIHLLKCPAKIQHAHGEFGNFWWQMHRGMVTIRHYYPALPLLTIATALPLSWSILFLITALLRNNHFSTGLFLVTLVFIFELVSAAALNAMLVRDAKLWRFLWLAGIRELVSVPILIHSTVSDEVLWRGRWWKVNC